jgi:hypothetical protein
MPSNQPSREGRSPVTPIHPLHPMLTRMRAHSYCSQPANTYRQARQAIHPRMRGLPHCQGNTCNAPIKAAHSSSDCMLPTIGFTAGKPAAHAMIIWGPIPTIGFITSCHRRPSRQASRDYLLPYTQGLDPSYHPREDMQGREHYTHN